MTVQKRGRIYHLKKRVPKRFANLEPREFVYQSLHTDSEAEARQKAEDVWREMVGAWEAEKAGETTLARERFEAAKELAARRGYRWHPASEVAGMPLGDILDRVEATLTRSGEPSRVRAEAFLGGAKQPVITVSGALQDYWTLAADKVKGKSEDQIRRWKNPRIKAVENFKKVVGDLPVADLTADDMLDFREWWWERIEAEGLTPNSANKDFTHLATVLKLVTKMRRLGFEPPVSGLAFSEGKSRPRPPFPTGFIRDKLLASGALGGLNTEARTIILGMINTGYRPSEGAALLKEHIHLDGQIPHIEILPDGRTLKTRRSERKIPLVGVSLEAFRAQSTGTPRYRDKPGLSATLNKFMRANNLMPSSEHTVYGLRHAFEDRLLVARVDERVRRDLMGHRLDREEYGIGGGLEVRFDAVKAISL
jgi:integrase